MRVKELLDLSLILTLKVHPLRYPAKSLGLIWPILGLITGLMRPMRGLLTPSLNIKPHV
jgi:hypothetical protein